MPNHAKTCLFFIWLFVSCGEAFREKAPGRESRLQKITISPDQVFDLSGYAGGGGGNPYHVCSMKMRLLIPVMKNPGILLFPSPIASR